MSSLTQTAFFSRKALLIFIIILAVIFGLFVLFLIGMSVKNSIFPQKPLPASAAFGKIPSFSYFEGIDPPSGTQYAIETISGEFPQLPNSAKVFRIGLIESSFGARERVAIRAGKIKFSAQPEEVSSGVLRFIDPREQNRTLTVNVFTDEFIMDSDFRNDPTLLETRPRSAESAVESAYTFFQTYGFDVSKFPETKAKTRNLRIEAGELVEVQGLSSANFIEVLLSREDLDELPVLWPTADGSSISVIVSSKGVVFSKGLLLPIEEHSFSFYPLKGVEKAFEELKLGKAALNKEVDIGRVVIIDVTLGYIESQNNEGFLQPVYVFKGTDDLVAYVSAVDESWIREIPTGGS